MNTETIYAILILILLVFGALAGWLFARQRLSERVEQVDRERTELDEQWDTLHRTQRINERFWQARQALRAEAQHWGRGHE